MEFNVDRYDSAEGLLILSRKGVSASNVNWETLEVGQIVDGVVTGVNKGGLELDIKGMRAFMPSGQVDVYHVPDLTQFVNQKMTAEVTAFERQGKNIVLSRRNIVEREREDQKKKLMEELAEGQIRRGTVRSVLDFGAFIDLGGVDGLLHVSEMSFRRVRNPGEVVKIGDVLDVKVLKIDRETGKLSLSLKQVLGTDPWSDAGERYSIGSEVTGRVTKLPKLRRVHRSRRRNRRPAADWRDEPPPDQVGRGSRERGRHRSPRSSLGRSSRPANVIQSETGHTRSPARR